MFIFLHSWEASLSTRLGGVYGWASWLRMDGGLKCPWFLVHERRPPGESVWDRVLAWGGSTKDLDCDGSGFPWCLPVLVRHPPPHHCSAGSGQREGAVLSCYRPHEQDSLSSNATLPWWFVNLDSAGPRIPWVVAKGLCAKKKV